MGEGEHNIKLTTCVHAPGTGGQGADTCSCTIIYLVKILLNLLTSSMDPLVCVQLPLTYSISRRFTSPSNNATLSELDVHDRLTSPCSQLREGEGGYNAV